MTAFIRIATGSAILSALLVASVARAASGTGPVDAAAPATTAEAFVHGRVALRLAPVLAALERAVPTETGTGEAHETIESGVEIRYAIHRDPFRALVRRDTIWISAKVCYWLEARGSGFGSVSCGSRTQPMTGEIGCLTRIGWRDDWHVEARSRRLPTVYATRCKPKPPAINFTALCNERLERDIVGTLAIAIDSALARTDVIRAQVEEAWRSLHRPTLLGSTGRSLAFQPRRLVASPFQGAGDSLWASIAIVASPRILDESPSTVGNVPLPQNQVRLAGDDFVVPLELEVPFDTLRHRALARCAAHGQGSHGDIEVRDVRLQPSGGKLAITLDVGGSLGGRFRLIGTPSAESSGHGLAVRDLEFVEGPSGSRTKRASAERNGERDELRRCIEGSLQIDLSREIGVAVGALQRALNRPLGEGVNLHGGLNQRRSPRAYVTPRAMGMRLEAVGNARITLD